MKVSFIIPTYQRPAHLARAVESLWAQERRPDEILVITRAGDAPTNDAVARLRAASPVSLRQTAVSIPGHLPPLVAGIEAAAGDVLYFMDDDCEALPDLLRRALLLYEAEDVVGVGGRIVWMEQGQERFPGETTRQLPRLSWRGKIRGDFNRDTALPGPHEVDYFAGGNASYRRDALRKIEILMALNRDVAFHYEVDWGLQLRRAGHRLLYDGALKMRHYTAPRATAGLRARNAQAAEAYSHNVTLIMRRHLPAPRRLAFLLHFFLVGNRTAWGPLGALADTLRTGRLRWRGLLAPACRGKWAGLQAPAAVIPPRKEGA